MSQVVAILDGLIGESLHTQTGSVMNLYTGGSPTGDTIPNPREVQQVVAIRNLGTNPMYVGFKSANLTATRYIYKIQSTDTQATMISVNSGVDLFTLGTLNDTYSLTRIR